MTRDETRTLLAAIASLDDDRRFTTPDIDGWHALLGDLDFTDARAAVLRHYASRVTAIKPAHIRRIHAHTNGRLAPTPDTAWNAIITVAANDGDGAGQLHPAAADAYYALGGAPSIRTQPEGVVRAQFRDLYAGIAERHDQWAIGYGVPSLPPLRMRSTPALTTGDQEHDREHLDEPIPLDPTQLALGRGAKMPAELRGAARPGMSGGGSGPVDAPAESA